MAQITNTQLFAPISVPTSVDVLFTVGSTPSTNILKNGSVKVVNRTTGDLTFSLWETPSGVARGDDNNGVTDYEILANNYAIIPLGEIPAGTIVYHEASGAGLTIHHHRGYLLG